MLFARRELIGALARLIFHRKGRLEMAKFPHQFSELLTPYGLRILKGESEHARSLFHNTKKYFVMLEKVIDRNKARDCMEALDKHLYQYLAVEQRRIAPDSITGMKENYSEMLNKTTHVRTAFFRRRIARSYRAAERIGLLQMMRSDSFTDFAGVVTGFKLDRDLNLQVICYEQGDYAGPHNDHHPEEESTKHGYIDFHIMFTNQSVAHHYLVYEVRGHFSEIIDVNIQGGISIYKLPFWHYTTPLAGKPGHEREARRWLLLGTFKIIDGNDTHS